MSDPGRPSAEPAQQRRSALRMAVALAAIAIVIYAWGILSRL